MANPGKSSGKELKISFRKSTNEDFDFVFKLNKTNMQKYVEKIRGWDEEAERKDMKDKFTADIDLIIQINGEDAGVLRVLEKEGSINLGHIELLPKFQNQDVGSKIIEGVIRKNKPVTLQVLKSNPAVELYKRLGFEIMGETDLKYKMSIQVSPKSTVNR